MNAPAVVSVTGSGGPNRGFDHRDRGNPPQVWQSLLDGLPELAVPGPGTQILALAAHPDDETLGCGGILALAADRGHPITVIIATDGEASHPASPTHSAGMLAAMRRVEAASAVSVLAPSARLVQLGLPDGHLDASAAALRAAVRDALAPGPAWILSPWEQDRHPDHAACARAVRHVGARRGDCVIGEYPIWAWHWADPGDHGFPVTAMHRVPVGAAAAARRQEALRCYGSQLLPLSGEPGDEAMLGPHVTAHFDRACDVLVDPRGCAGRPDYFQERYAGSDDPWGSGTRWYERRKRDLLLASLPRRRFASAFEPGCGPGHLTTMLASRCDEVLATDAAPRAVALAGAATAALPGVSVAQLDINDAWPQTRYDLVVLSEIGYYVSDLDRLARRISSGLRDDGVVVLCHWRHRAIEHLHAAETVHKAIRRRTGLSLLAAHREEDFLLDVLGVDGISVARADGVLD
jgi:LmbE family N-acetylglucosaminyl deacetylase/SAM-dependent methyltransferase